MKINPFVSIIASVIFCLFVASFVSARYDNVIRVEAMGSLPVSIDTVNPDSLVLADAFRRAVAKAVETFIPKSEMDGIALILDEKIYSNASRYILNYRVISKDVIEDEFSVLEGGVPVYTVSIYADVAMDIMREDLAAAGLLYEAEINKVIVAIVNLRDYKVFELFKKSLRELKAVKGIHYNSFARDTIELVVESTEDIEELKENIMSIDISGWKIEATATASWFFTDRIEVVFSLLSKEMDL